MTSSYWVFSEQLSDQRRVQVCPDFCDDVVFKDANPAITIVKSHTIFRHRQRMQFNYGVMILHEDVLDAQLRALRKHFSKFGECAAYEIGLRTIVTGQWMRTHHGPIDII